MPQFTSGTMNRYMSKWLIGTGIFELLLAAGFAFGAITATSSLWLAAGILAATGVGLVFWGMRSHAKAEEVQLLETSGLPGQATIVGMTQTGMYINEQPQIKLQLRVEAPGRPVFQVEHKEIIPLMLLSAIGVGRTLPVKIDPNDQSNLVIEWGEAAASGPMMAPGMQPATTAPGLVSTPISGLPSTPTSGSGVDESMSQVQQALESSGMSATRAYQTAEQGGYSIEQIRQYVRANGLDGRATIDRFEDSGKTVGDERLFTMQATVQVEGKPPYQTPVSAAMVPAAAFAKVAVGTSVPVKVAKDNPDLIVFEWERI